MAIKYYTKEAALTAVSQDGSNLSFVSQNLLDDYDVVRAAVLNGAYLSQASLRLQYDIQLNLLVAAQKLAGERANDYDYLEALFCSKNDVGMRDQYLSRLPYSSWDDFIVELKLFYGDNFHSPIERYNSMSQTELTDELNRLRLAIVDACRIVYRRHYSIYTLERNTQLSTTIHHPFLRFLSTGYDEFQKPFSSFVDKIAQKVDAAAKLQDPIKAKGSFPERYIASLLKQLNVNYVQEQVFPWSKASDGMGVRRYDFYVPSLNAIIEVHGAQHYEQGFDSIGGRSFEEERANDILKEKLAIDNGIKHYIVINALSSSPVFISESVKGNRDFCQLFNLTNVNWDEVAQNASNRYVFADSLYLEEVIAYYKGWLATFEGAMRKQDYELPRKAKSANRATGKNVFLSENGLLPNEIVFLEKARTYQVNNIPAWAHDYWYSHYGLLSVDECLEKLLSKGLLYKEGISAHLEKATVADLKKCLSDNHMETAGKKEELLIRVKKHIPADKIDASVQKLYYTLSKKGDQELAASKYLFAAKYMGLTIWEANKLYHTDRDSFMAEYHKQMAVSNPNFLLYPQKTLTEPHKLTESNVFSVIKSWFARLLKR